MDAFQQSEALVQARMDIAVHKAEIHALRSDMAEMKDALEEVQKALQGIQSVLSEARGGWRTLMLVGGAGTTLGAAVAWLVEHLGRRG